ncbi:hypothetical protein L6R52_38825, partial [Myxococcota bacterium]|nr:hypothetical protein [Myxococcota bacterium]
LVAPSTGALADPAARYAKDGTPTPDDATAARGFHAAALDHLGRQDLPGAEGLLRQCIEAADLPECHRTLGTILSLTGHPAARTHFDHYLHIAPSAPDADAIRRLLQNP